MFYYYLPELPLAFEIVFLFFLSLHSMIGAVLSPQDSGTTSSRRTGEGKNPPQVVYFLRKPKSGAHSIEEVFKNLHAYLTEAVASFRPAVKTAPAYSHTIFSILRNIVFAARHQGAVNHVTGDTHYMILGMSRKNRNILTIHDCALLHRFPRFSIRYWLYKWLWLDLPVRWATIVTTISETTRADILRFTGCDPAKIVVIPNYVNPLFRPSPEHFRPDEPRILQLGTAANKNLERVIPALKGIPCTFEIVGRLGSKQRDLLRRYNIRFENSSDLSYEEVAQKYRDCDLVVFASTFEGFGMPVIEAQASGRPVITSNIFPLRDVAGDAAHLVDPYDVEDIQAGLRKLIDDPVYRHTLVSKGLKNVDRFRIDAVAGQYLNLYSDSTASNICVGSPELSAGKTRDQ